MNKTNKYKTTGQIKDILIHEGLTKIIGSNSIGIFGSFARKEDYKDIDILIDLPLDILALYDLKNSLKKKYGLKIDFMIKEYADPIILRNALKDIIYVQFN